MDYYKVIIIESYYFEKSVIVDEKHFSNRIEAMNFVSDMINNNKIAVMFRMGD